MEKLLVITATALVLLAAPLGAAGQTPTPGASVRRLSVDEAVSLALEQNVDIRVERLNPEIQEMSARVARTAWTPNFTATFDDGRQKTPATSIFSGADGILSRDEAGATVGWGQLLPWGASYGIAWDSAHVRSNAVFDTPNPATSSTLTLSYVQPLLRNFRIDGARQRLLIARANGRISDIRLRETVAGTIRNVKTAYWNLAYARSSLAVQEQSLGLARASLQNTRARLDAGMAAPLDVVEAEAEVAQREEAVIVVGAGAARAEDRLRTLIFDPDMDEFWNVRLELADRPDASPARIDVDAAVRRAFDRRTDLLAMGKSIEIADTNIRYLRNQELPDVRLQLDHALAGLSGTALQFGPGFPPSVIGQHDAGPTFGNLVDNGSWRVSVSVSYPIGTGPAQAEVARERLVRTQAEARVVRLRLQIATEVRDAARQVDVNAKRIAATKAARELAERRLESEEKRFAAGRSTTFVVFQAQRDLEQARNAELRATLDYRISLVDFEVAQEAPLASDRPSVPPAGASR